MDEYYSGFFFVKVIQGNVYNRQSLKNIRRKRPN